MPPSQLTREERLNRVREGFKEANDHLRVGKLADAIPILNQVAGLLTGESDPEWVRARTEISRTLIEVSVQYGDYLRSRSEFAEAVKAYENASSDVKGAEGIVLAHFQGGQDEKAFSALERLKFLDSTRATLLRANLLFENGALPLAIAELEKISSNSDARERLNALEKKGLRRFSQETMDGWVIFHANEASGEERPVQYLFRDKDGAPDATRPLSLSVRPALREFSWGLLWRSLLHLRWPVTSGAKEYSLISQGGRRVDVVAIWDYLPEADEMLDYASWAYDGLPDMQQAENYFHTDRHSEALSLLEGLARVDESWCHPRQPYYSALIQLMKVGHASGSNWGEKARRALLGWHPVWGAIAIAKARVEEGKPDEARKVFEQAVEAGSLRYEPISQLAEFEWEQAKQLKGQDRAAALIRTQHAIGRLQEIRPSEALLMQAEVFIDLSSYALASEALRKLKGAEPPYEVVQLQEFLTGLHQDEFSFVGQVKSPRGDFTLDVFRCTRMLPENPSLIFHTAEIVVRDREGYHVETFAISSQGIPLGSPRSLFLDRINANGLETVQVFGQKAPDALTLARRLAER